MGNVQDDITKIIQTEGGSVNNPADSGGRTFEGISEKSNPDLWKHGPPTPEQVRQRYMECFVVGPGYDKITDSKLQYQLIDFGVNSSPYIATKRLQEILGVHPDGLMGTITLDALAKTDPRVVNNKLVIARLKMIGNLITTRANQAQFALGWISRACEFFEP